MTPQKTVRVAVNGYGVIGKRVADAIAMQHDMTLAGISNVAADWRMSIVTRKGFGLYGATGEHARAMEKAGISMAGTLDELLRQADLVVDCTPKKFGAKNAEAYRRAGVKFIVEGGEEHAVAGHSFVAEANYTSALGTRAGGDPYRLLQYNLDRPHADSAETGRPSPTGSQHLAAPRHRPMGEPSGWYHEYARPGVAHSKPPEPRRPKRGS